MPVDKKKNQKNKLKGLQNHFQLHYQMALVDPVALYHLYPT